jgi:hypothetical protein
MGGRQHEHGRKPNAPRPARDHPIIAAAHARGCTSQSTAERSRGHLARRNRLPRTFDVAPVPGVRPRRGRIDGRAGPRGSADSGPAAILSAPPAIAPTGPGTMVRLPVAAYRLRLVRVSPTDPAESIGAYSLPPGAARGLAWACPSQSCDAPYGELFPAWSPEVNTRRRRGCRAPSTSCSARPPSRPSGGPSRRRRWPRSEAPAACSASPPAPGTCRRPAL